MLWCGAVSCGALTFAISDQMRKKSRLQHYHLQILIALGSKAGTEMFLYFAAATHLHKRHYETV